MARGGGGVKWSCSYKRTTLIVCSINIVVALYILRSLYASLYNFSNTSDLNHPVKYTPDQLKRMEESVRIRRENEPVKLIQLVKGLKNKEIFRRKTETELPLDVKNKISSEILLRLKQLAVNATNSDRREVVDSWRNEKLKAAKRLELEKESTNSTTLQQEARMLVRALESDWPVLLEEIGFWVPDEVTHVEHNDKPEGADETEEEEEILPGQPVPVECHAELHTDYDGVAVRWGLTHHKESAADCCKACLDQAKRAKPGEMKCNIWVYCPSERGCYSPDRYEHRNTECWLKYAEKPRLNFKDKYPESYRSTHPTAPMVVPWVSGVVSV